MPFKKKIRNQVFLLEEYECPCGREKKEEMGGSGV
jgi:hypothetical protein